MPHYIIWSAGKPRRSVPRDTIYLRLVQHQGTPTVVACNADGARMDNGNLVSFTPTGSVRAHGGINQSVPIRRGEDNNIVAVSSYSDRPLV